MRLHEENKFTLDDADKIMIGLTELFKHLNNRYKVNEKLNTEVDRMVRTLIDPNVIYNAKIQIVKKAINEGLSLELISKLTGFDIDTLEALQEQLEREQNE